MNPKDLEEERRTGAILMVEDCPDDAATLEMLFQQMGVLNPLHIVSNGEQALAYLQGAGQYADRTQYPMPSVVFVDLKLPGMDGFELLKELKTFHLPGSPLVIAISGLEDLASIRRAYALGARSFVVKPCEGPDLENLLVGFPAYWLRSATVASLG